MLPFQMHVKNIRPRSRRGRKGFEPLPRDGSIHEDNAGRERGIPRVVLEFPPE
jgi:hypothetical protein